MIGMESRVVREAERVLLDHRLALVDQGIVDPPTNLVGVLAILVLVGLFWVTVGLLLASI